jgi:hypothetical protein
MRIHSLLLPSMIAAAMTASSVQAQATCRTDTVAVVTSVVPSGFGGEEGNILEKNLWRNAVLRLFERCELCEDRGDAMLIATGFRADSGFKVLFPPDSVQFDPKTGARLRPIGAMVAITINNETPGRLDQDSFTVGITWQWMQNRYNQVRTPPISIRRVHLRDREKLVDRLVDQLRRVPSLSCLFTAHTPTRFSWTSRVGLWTGEIVNEEDFGSNDDLRLQTVSVGFLVERPLNLWTDLRLRFDGTVAFPYMTARGGSVFTADQWEESPLLIPSLGVFAVLHPFGRTSPVHGVLGGEAIGYGRKSYSFRTNPINPPDSEWRPSVSVPLQLDFGFTGGLGVTTPVRIEVLARLSSPKVYFIGDPRSPPLFDLSASVEF